MRVASKHRRIGKYSPGRHNTLENIRSAQSSTNQPTAHTIHVGSLNHHICILERIHISISNYGEVYTCLNLQPRTCTGSVRRFVPKPLMACSAHLSDFIIAYRYARSLLVGTPMDSKPRCTGCFDPLRQFHGLAVRGVLIKRGKHIARRQHSPDVIVYTNLDGYGTLTSFNGAAHHVL